MKSHDARNQAFQEVIDRFKMYFCPACDKSYTTNGRIHYHRACLKYYDAIKLVESMIFEIPQG